MHGYDSRFSDMHGIFFASGPSFKKNVVVDAFENINIYPILCKTLSINPYIENINWDKTIIKKTLIR